MSGHLGGRVAIVTGANHGIGAATATTLAARGAAVLATYLRLTDPEEPGTPAAYAQNRARTAEGVLTGIRAHGGNVIAIEADLADPAAPNRLFDAAEAELGPVDILINNASSWQQDSFVPGAEDPVGRRPRILTVDSIRHNLAVDVVRRCTDDRRVRQAPHRPRRGVGSHRRSHVRG